MTPNGRDIIRAGYQAGRPVEAIARDCQSTPGSVKVIAHRMGLRHRRHVSEFVPAELLADYRLFTRRKHLPQAYACKVLGITL